MPPPCWPMADCTPYCDTSTRIWPPSGAPVAVRAAARGCTRPGTGASRAGHPGCRKRATPASVRFLGPKVYVSAVVVLIAALRCGPTPARCRVLEELVGASRRTIGRWRRWWTEELIDTPFWRAAAGTLMPLVATAELPAVLLERFAGDTRDRLLAALRWLSPITIRSAAVQAT
jgi:hypothetical protein